MAQHVEHVQRQFSEQEMLEFGKHQARLLAEIDALEQQKKDASDHFKAEITKLETQVGFFTSQINRGYEIIETPCDVIMDTPTKGMKSFVDKKTLNTVRVVPMDERDKQSGLFGE